MPSEETLDLFPSAVSESPRLAWLCEHDLIVREYQHPHSLNGSQRWVCSNRAQTNYACGSSEDEACLRYCERMGIVFYKEREFREACK